MFTKVLTTFLFISFAFILVFSVSAHAEYWADYVFDYTGNPNPNFNWGTDVDGDGWADPEDSFYNSGGNPNVALGAPDESFVSIYEGEFITYGFSTAFVDGTGDDFYIVETGHAGEGATVEVSSDGINFTNIGTVTVPNSGGNATQFGDYYGFDLNGFFAGPVSYVRISDAVEGASPGFDLAGIQAVTAVPEPASSALFIVGSAIMGFRLYRKKRTA